MGYAAHRKRCSFQSGAAEAQAGQLLRLRTILAQVRHQAEIQSDPGLAEAAGELEIAIRLLTGRC